MSSKNILIADNDPSIISVFEFILQQVGYTAHTTQTARRCQDLIKQNPSISVAFIDINLKDLNGLDWIKEILKNNPNLRILLMTGYGVDNILVPAFDAGIYGVIYKPFDVEEVVEILDAIFKPQKADARKT
jgi:DNA-binding NtrC family response regulator